MQSALVVTSEDMGKIKISNPIRRKKFKHSGREAMCLNNLSNMLTVKNY